MSFKLHGLTKLLLYIGQLSVNRFGEAVDPSAMKVDLLVDGRHVVFDFRRQAGEGPRCQLALKHNVTVENGSHGVCNRIVHVIAFNKDRIKRRDGAARRCERRA